jgi:hypothetical protein
MPLHEPTWHRTVGSQGERAPGKLYWHQDDPIEEGLRLSVESVPTLYKQTQAWLADFFPGAAFDVQQVPGANLVTLGIRTSPDTDIFCPWHGKVKIEQMRMHFTFPIQHDRPVYVVYIGPKITKR